MFEIFNEIINKFYKEADEFIEGRKENKANE
jgi:hypothetical protein